MIGSRLTRHYSFHGVAIEVTTDWAALTSAIDSRLRWLARAPAPRADVRFDFRRIPSTERQSFKRPENPTRPVYESSLVSAVYSETRDELSIGSDDRVWVRCSPAEGATSVSYVADEPNDVWLLSHGMFTLPLLEVLKRRGMYSLHAAAVALDHRSILLAGPSGAGKSTLALALARAQFDFLGDDMVFLHATADSGGVTVLAFPDEVDVTDETARLLPELARLVDPAPPAGYPKRPVRVEDIYAARVVPSSRASLLVFPRIAGTERSVLESLDPGEALLDLAPNILLTERCSSQAHLDTLAALVRTVPCHRLHMGRDLEEVVGCLRACLQSTPRSVATV